MSEVELIINMTFVTKNPKGAIVELKPRDGVVPPRHMPGIGMTGEGYGSVDCTGDLSTDELRSLVRFLNSKIGERVVAQSSIYLPCPKCRSCSFTRELRPDGYTECMNCKHRILSAEWDKNRISHSASEGEK